MVFLILSQKQFLARNSSDPVLNIPSPWPSCLWALRARLSFQNAAHGYSNSAPRWVTAPDQLRQQNGSTFFTLWCSSMRFSGRGEVGRQVPTCRHCKTSPITLHRTSVSVPATGNLILLIPCKFEIPFNFFTTSCPDQRVPGCQFVHGKSR